MSELLIRKYVQHLAGILGLASLGSRTRDQEPPEVEQGWGGGGCKHLGLQDQGDPGGGEKHMRARREGGLRWFRSSPYFYRYNPSLIP